MYLKKLVSTVVFCTIVFLSNSVMAGLWAVNCEKEQCLEVSEEGTIIVSNCEESKKAQVWEQKSPRPNGLVNKYTGNCLEVIDANNVIENECKCSCCQTQIWFSPDNSQEGQIRNVQWNECLTVDGISVKTVKCNQNSLPSERWKMLNAGDTKHLSCSNKSSSLDAHPFASCKLRYRIGEEHSNTATECLSGESFNKLDFKFFSKTDNRHIHVVVTPRDGIKHGDEKDGKEKNTHTSKHNEVVVTIDGTTWRSTRNVASSLKYTGTESFHIIPCSSKQKSYLGYIRILYTEGRFKATNIPSSSGKESPLTISFGEFKRKIQYDNCGK